jgi:hypothetical protein
MCATTEVRSFVPNAVFIPDSACWKDERARFGAPPSNPCFSRLRGDVQDSQLSHHTSRPQAASP